MAVASTLHFAVVGALPEVSSREQLFPFFAHALQLHWTRKVVWEWALNISGVPGVTLLKTI